MNDKNKTNIIGDLEINPIDECCTNMVAEKVDYKKIYFDNQMEIAEKNLVLKKYKEANKIYKKLTRKYKDYRPWLKMFDILVLKKVKIDKIVYHKYHNSALLYCKTNEEVKLVNEKYDSVFNSQKQYESGLECQKKSEFKKALYWFKKAANQVHLKSILEAGNCYYEGKGVLVRSTKKARHWWEIGAEAGELECYYKLGKSYVRKHPYKKIKAIYYYQIGAEKGNANCQYELGLYYLNGSGVEKNKNTAVAWLDRAANNKHGEAANLLGGYYLNGIYITRDSTKGIKYLEMAAECDNVNALNALGYYYSADKQKAAKYLKRASMLGSENADRIMKSLGIKF